MEIIGDIKTYDWGKLGNQSEVAKLAKLNCPKDFQPDEAVPYSELWMGQHVSGPSKLKSSGETLDAFINRDREGFIGGYDCLPFLFKVLSIRKALSIQVHPDKTEAEKLHSVYPEIYKDANHKPELAIALTPFLALCGFRPYAEIQQLTTLFPPLTELIGKDLIGYLTNSDGLKNCYTKLMTSDNEKIKKCIETINKGYQEELTAQNLDEIFTKINNDFPNDVGTLSLFFLNVLRLQPGEAIFLPANEPHAYLHGDCLECMACSDNVVRAGLTPKFKDIKTLLRLLNYQGSASDEKIFKPRQMDGFTQLFSPPVKDFALIKMKIPSEQKSYKYETVKTGAILLVLNGKGQLITERFGKVDISRGSIIFIPGNSGEFVQLELERESADVFVAYQAMSNSFLNE